ncbi:vWA domain-containing protein [Reichenbachiella versicolor]|uniref:vWA domain-containing protein n=1 Tax=Reichenbachiella versicolor TaxID=1821036 RepID=UPI000D6DD054|nr:VWA domain-containing protein [Reichenbachiella versicolor]
MNAKITILTLFVMSVVLQSNTSLITITGTITDENNTPLVGVTVSAKKARNKTISGLNGKYNIKVQPDDLLRFEFIGFDTQEIKVKKRSKIDVSMRCLIQEELEEVVILDETNQQTKEITGAVLRSSPKQARKLMVNKAEKMSFTISAPSYYEYESDIIDFNTEEYDLIKENGFKSPESAPLSTFSIDVDNASYSNVRRMIENGQKPYIDAVRIEEMINYFSYDYEDPTGTTPFSVNTEVSTAPWNSKHRLVHIGIQGKKLDINTKVNSNLVFLIDVSGSMSSQNKLPLLKSSMKTLVNNLSSNDRVAIVVYAGAAGLALPSTPADRKEIIFSALDKLSAGGSTAGGAGIELAYKVANENLIKGGNNRVILATDGDFNTGSSSNSEMVRLIEEKRNTGIYLTITGFGMGNYKDSKMEQISNAGNGNYFYIDSYKEATKVFGEEMQATLFTIAKDVKIQVEFNPNVVQAYRLIGYENRKLNDEDFNNDNIDAGELGAGHSVTALYEIIPAGIESTFIKNVDKLKYQNTKTISTDSNEILTVKLRYKPINSDKSKLISKAVVNHIIPLIETSNNFRFSASVAEFGMILRNSEYKQTAELSEALKLAMNSKGHDELGYRQEFIGLIKSYAFIEGKSLTQR